MRKVRKGTQTIRREQTTPDMIKHHLFFELRSGRVEFAMPLPGLGTDLIILY